MAFNRKDSDRKPASTDAVRAERMKSVVASISHYRIEGNEWITSVETAWAPDWVGTEQPRTVRLTGDVAEVMPLWRAMPNWGAGHLSRSRVRFEHIASVRSS
ncbi:MULTISPECIES: lipocalin-like domain-containing protein [unclassified Methylobacterium]|uniref:lipocalin-like domain-containing protein n=1 Tax=unclassified Methylobacterium TaxID=2615210 RepID=UPI003144F884